MLHAILLCIVYYWMYSVLCCLCAQTFCNTLKIAEWLGLVKINSRLFVLLCVSMAGTLVSLLHSLPAKFILTVCTAASGGLQICGLSV